MWPHDLRSYQRLRRYYKRIVHLRAINDADMAYYHLFNKITRFYATRKPKMLHQLYSNSSGNPTTILVDAVGHDNIKATSLFYLFGWEESKIYYGRYYTAMYNIMYFGCRYDYKCYMYETLMSFGEPLEIVSYRSDEYRKTVRAQLGME